MILNILLVGIGGFFGAMLRVLISSGLNQRTSSPFPYGTLSVNLAGAFLLGLIAGSQLGSPLELFLGTGFMGAFTTFSTFNLECIHLYLSKKWATLIAYLVISIGGGISLAFLGIILIS